MKSFFRLVIALVSIWICSTTNTFAQFEVTSESSQIDIKTQIEHVLSPLSMDPVTTGILLQRTMPLFDPDLRGIKAEPDSVYMSFDTHDLVYRNLYDARTPRSRFMAPELAYANAYTNYDQSDTIPVLLSAISYHMIDTAAVSDGRLRIAGGQLYYNTNDLASVYDIDEVYTSALFSYELSMQATFSLPSNLLVGNQDIDPSSITIDAGDGQGYQSISLGGYLNVTYPAYGDYTIKIRYRSVSGAYVTHFHKVKIIEANDGSRGKPIVFTCAAECVCEDIFSPDGTTGINVSYRLSCRDKDGNRSTNINDLKRPLILLDGIDLFWDGNNATMARTLADPRRGFEYSNVQIINELTLGEIMDNNDYDIVFVDYHDHHTGIEKNGAAVQQLLRRINNIKKVNGSQYENILMGISMGGVVGTFAVRDMELKGEDHDISDFITFDSPIQGGNIPVALQGLVLNANNFLRGFALLNVWELLGGEFKGKLSTVGTLKGMEKVFLSPSPKQMLLYNIYDNGNTHHDFYSLLETMGPVANAKTLAIANGSGTAVTDIAPSSLIVSVHDLTVHSGVTWENILFKFLWTIGKWSGILNIDVDLDAYTAPGRPIQGNKTILYDGTIRISLLFGLVNRYSSDIVYGNDNMRAIDSAPGGTIGTGAIGAAIDPAGLLPIGVDLRIQDFCFIPTVSALDIQPVGSDLMHTNLLTTNFTSTSYDAISTQVGPAPVVIGGVTQFNSDGSPMTTNNNGHVTMTYDNIVALFNAAEIQGENLGSTLLGRTYNFGQSASNDISQSGTYRPTSTGNSINKSLEVLNGGKLWINRDDRIGFTSTLTNRKNSKPSTFDVFIGRNVCAGIPTEVKINQNGELFIGQSDVNNIGSLTIKENNNKLIVGKGGIAIIDKKSKIVVERNGQMIIENGGTLVINDNAFLIVELLGSLVIESGAKVIIKGNGYIDIMNNAFFNVHKGAILDFEAPYNDGSFNKGSRIELSGIMAVSGGNLTIGGSGYLRFKLGHKMYSTTNTLELVGHGKSNISYVVDALVEVNHGNLNIKNAFLLFNQDVKYNGFNNGNNFTSTNSRFENNIPIILYQGTLIALQSFNLVINDAKSVNLNSTDFSDVKCIVTNCPYVSGNRVNALTFNKFKAIELVNVKRANFLLSTFKTEKPKYSFGVSSGGFNIFKTGIDLTKVKELRLNSCEISGFNHENGRTETIIISNFGIKSSKSSYIYLNKSQIFDCTYGIYGADAYNLTMEKSEIVKCKTGIQMEGSAETGLVKMTCSAIKNCELGITGADITLAIDGLINSQWKNSPTMNDFIDNITHFDLAFKLKGKPDVIYARYNNWTNHNRHNLLGILDQSEEGRGMPCLELNDPKIPDVDNCASLSPSFPIRSELVREELYRGFCPNEGTCTGQDIMESYWRGFSCYYHDDLNKAVEVMLPLGLDHYSGDNTDLQSYCKAMLTEANAFAAGMYEYEETGAYGLDVDATCGDIIDGVQTKVLTISSPNASNMTPQRIVWRTQAPGQIIGASNGPSITTNGKGTYSLHVQSTQGCKYSELIRVDSILLDCDTTIIDGGDTTIVIGGDTTIVTLNDTCTVFPVDVSYESSTDLFAYFYKTSSTSNELIGVWVDPVTYQYVDSFMTTTVNSNLTIKDVVIISAQEVIIAGVDQVLNSTTIIRYNYVTHQVINVNTINNFKVTKITAGDTIFIHGYDVTSAKYSTIFNYNGTWSYKNNLPKFSTPNWKSIVSNYWFNQITKNRYEQVRNGYTRVIIIPSVITTSTVEETNTEQLIVTGYFSQEIVINNQTYIPGSPTSIIILTYDIYGQITNVETLNTTSNVAVKSFTTDGYYNYYYCGYNVSNELINITTISNIDTLYGVAGTCTTDHGLTNENDGASKPNVLASDNLNDSKYIDARIYPNPFSRDITISWYSVESGNGTIEVIDGLGRKIVNKNVFLTQDDNTFILNEMSDTPSGIYTIRLSQGTHSQTLLAIKTN